jgi:16S rRNA (cytidine1402-2'-O)-methyltransferase
VRGTTGELAAALEGRELKGEVVLLIGPPVAGEEPIVTDESIRAAVHALIAEGLSRKDAVRQVATELGVPRNEAYRVSLFSE